jgi:N-acetylneuraminate synthase
MVKIIAEISGNHRGDINRAKELIFECAKNGADMVKLQAYTPDTITLKADTPDFKVNWRGRSVNLFDLYTEAHTPLRWMPELFNFARKNKINLFASVFDKSSVDILRDLDCPAYKIASFEITDTTLISYAARTLKPMFISTGMATLADIERAVNAVKSTQPNWTKFSNTQEIVLMHCISAYPAQPEHSYLLNIKELSSRFHCAIGLSDHTMNNTAAIAATALGAQYIEKHVTLDPNGHGPDDHFSITPEQLAALRKDLDDTANALHYSFDEKAVEAGSRVFRRSLYFVKPVSAGETITAEHFRSVRPGYGLPPHLDWMVEGTKAKKDAQPNTPVTWEHIK